MRKGVLMFSQSKTKLCHTKTGIKMTANVQEVVWKKAFFLTVDEEKKYWDTILYWRTIFNTTSSVWLGF